MKTLIAVMMILTPVVAHAAPLPSCRDFLGAISTGDIPRGARYVGILETGMGVQDAVATAMNHVQPIHPDVTQDDRTMSLKVMYAACVQHPDASMHDIILTVYGFHRIMQGVGKANGSE